MYLYTLYLTVNICYIHYLISIHSYIYIWLSINIYPSIQMFWATHIYSDISLTLSWSIHRYTSLTFYLSSILYTSLIAYLSIFMNLSTIYLLFDIPLYLFIGAFIYHVLILQSHLFLLLATHSLTICVSIISYRFLCLIMPAFVWDISLCSHSIPNAP